MSLPLDHSQLHPLPHLAVFSAQGPDAGTFLQGQLTQDVLAMRPDEARAGGYCSAKGRLLGNFVIVHPAPDTWWFVTHAEVAPALVKRLKMFVLRAKCSIALREDLGVYGAPLASPTHDTSALPPWRVFAPPSASTAPADGTAPNSAAIGWYRDRALCVAPANVGVAAGADDPATAWKWEDVQAGWPWIQAATVEQFVPQMVNFEVLGGVNFRKGCYPGQEVVARSQYRGTLKRRMALVEVQTTTATAGMEVFDTEDPDQPAGMVVNAAADPAGVPRALLLVELKLAAQVEDRLRLGSPSGPALSMRTLPYGIPVDGQT